MVHWFGYVLLNVVYYVTLKNNTTISEMQSNTWQAVEKLLVFLLSNPSLLLKWRDSFSDDSMQSFVFNFMDEAFIFMLMQIFLTNLFKLKAGNRNGQINHTTERAGVWPLPQTRLSLRKQGASSKKCVVRLVYANKYSDWLINNMCLCSL